MNKEELRREFEKTDTFKKCNHWALKFNKEKQTYFSEHMTHISDAIALNSAWLMFQELEIATGCRL